MGWDEAAIAKALADYEGERGDDGRREPRPVEQRSHGVAEVLGDDLHGKVRLAVGGGRLA